MTTEPGSDQLFTDYGDVGAINRSARSARLRSLVEEWRVRQQPTVDDPGEQRPDVDETPPLDEPHPEFDPTPPE